MLTERGNIKECFQGQSRNRALQTGGMTRLAERFSEREKQQKVQSVMLPVFNTDQKIPQHSHLPDFIKQNRGEGWEINSK